MEIHIKDIVHLDLKPENVVRIDGKWKIIDFGLAFFGSCFLEEDYSDRYVMTTGYKPPEVEYHGKISSKADIYSLGLIFLHVATKGIHIDNIINSPGYEDQLEYLDDIIENEDIVNESFMSLLFKMLDPDPLKRPTIWDVIKDLFFGNRYQHISHPDCHSIVSKGLVANNGLGIVTKIRLTELKKYCDHYRLRHATFFYMAQLMTMADDYKRYSFTALFTLSLHINSDEDDPCCIDIANVQEYLPLLTYLNINDVLFHTPYSILVSTIGKDDVAVEILYSTIINHPNIYFNHPQLLIDGIVDFRKGHFNSKSLMTLANDHDVHIEQIRKTPRG